MGANSAIEWCDHTFNPWMGCTKVSAGCKNCYAETLMDKRWGKVAWGPQGKRVRTSAANWKKPLLWNRDVWMQCSSCRRRGKIVVIDSNIVLDSDEAEYFCPACGEYLEETRQRVFCASLADVFEELPELLEWRAELFDMIDATPNLDWLILTKRPENVLANMVLWGIDELPANVWIGTSVEDQETADERIARLLEIPAQIHFLSCEPLLGPIDLSLRGYNFGRTFPTWSESVDWVICGGESGPQARPMHPDWARSIRDQCQEAEVPFFFKQWGEFTEMQDPQPMDWVDHAFGGPHQKMVYMQRVGKHAAGQQLDGREWSEFPETSHA